MILLMKECNSIRMVIVLSQEWKYYIPLQDNSLMKFEEKCGIVIPNELSIFITKHNASTPSMYKFVSGNIEHLLGSVLDFNEVCKDTDSIYTAVESIGKCELLPFGIDPFGNYICIDFTNNNIIFWNHEDSSISFVANSLPEFISMLY